jgi:DNA-directed RNA polymerase I subunit RPA1
MSFETTTKFLSEATLYGDYDSLRSPSSCIAMGRPIRCVRVSLCPVLSR